ncbi:Adaptin N terminal region family protein [Trichomonas vaginalis G3]|uniref:Adaptin N terminal region family protein n=1 Tax=Trichomonas vaginalis (strain ATCC PRA-98 / G3) TaxID=412133 RepID=A2ER45_TRIV3|nr:clathrin binding [Trichomonas vaginalis G3]EAY04864.1 Adaptin N terminal region family protein [Trichomonas vaginalis G3]KAI5495304.1 clathrin binding [Trichomonas vaginalis G3]|eukprot:XP_001317087.1 Adaptin N terminal region family protein [Trichomonas vaginalis G3]
MTNLIGESSNLKGEFLELREKLDGNDTKLRKEAAKRVVSLMRSGEDCSILFSSMLRSINTDDLELKRLVYIYILTYSTSEEEESIMAVSAMLKDSEHYNPLVRSLAIRSMTKIKIEAFAENIIAQVKKSLQDKDPYVRKTAALGVAKIFSTIPETVESIDIYKSLIDLLKDDNPLVISNAIAAICEINSLRSSPIMKLDSTNIVYLLNAFSDSSEWCQINLLDALSTYLPESSSDAHMLIERFATLMMSSNPAVVIGAFKCIFIYMEYDIHDIGEILTKVLPPLLALVGSTPPEIQFVLLRTLSLFSQKYPKSLASSIATFYCKYNDPSYIKVEKLSIISNIVVEGTLRTALDELQEYCNDIDVHFAKKAIKTLSQIALKFENAATKCIDILVDLIKGKADYAIEQSIIVLPDILRKYPKKFDGTIAIVCQSCDQIKSSDAKSSFIWILGEYCHLIDNADVILDPYLDSFQDESPFVQLSLVTALIKCYLNNPERSKDQLQFVLDACQKDNIMPDVRNRALIYWTILSNHPQEMKDIVNVEKTCTWDSSHYSQEVLSTLISNIGSVSGVLHIVPSDFTTETVYIAMEDSLTLKLKEVETNGILKVSAAIGPRNIEIKLQNISGQDLTGLAIALNKNIFGIVIHNFIGFPEKLCVSEEITVEVPYTLDSSAVDKSSTSPSIQVAIRTSSGVCFFSVPFKLKNAIEKLSPKKNEFLDMWTEFPDGATVTLKGEKVADNDLLFKRKFYVIARAKGKVAGGLRICNQIVLASVVFDDSGVTCVLEGEELPSNIIAMYAKKLFCV